MLLIETECPVPNVGRTTSLRNRKNQLSGFEYRKGVTEAFSFLMWEPVIRYISVDFFLVPYFEKTGNDVGFIEGGPARTVI